MFPGAKEMNRRYASMNNIVNLFIAGGPLMDLGDSSTRMAYGNIGEVAPVGEFE